MKEDVLKGADDDYLKPFDSEVLLMKIKASFKENLLIQNRNKFNMNWKIFTLPKIKTFDI
jgi:DNA-binding response OmpR family regulator